MIIPVIIICLLIAPANLSTSLLIGGISMMLMFIGRVRTRHIMIVVGGAMIPLLFLVFISKHYYNKEEHASKELTGIFTLGRMSTWVKRVQNFIYAGRENESYQVQQSKIAIAKGFFEKGVLKPTVKAGEVIAWLKKDFDLGYGHSLAIYHSFKDPNKTTNR